MALKERLALFNSVLGAPYIDIKALKQICVQGIPDGDGSMRPLCWKILLDYLPCDLNEWASFLSKQRQNYANMLDEFIVNVAKQSESNVSDHPLNPCPDSNWSEFFRDNSVLLQIDKDVRRLCPEIAFFQQPTEFPNKAVQAIGNPLNNRVDQEFLESQDLKVTISGAANLVDESKRKRKQAQELYIPLGRGKEANWQIVERILFIYSKLNPGVKYIQGMNEVLGPLYYVMASDSKVEWREFAEADTFYCFQNLMSEIKDNFIKNLDSSSCGIAHNMSQLMDLVRVRDPQLYNHMHITQNIIPEYFAFRWLSLLLSQEFPLPDVIQLWDSLYADETRFDLLLYLCLAMIIDVRYQMLENDFGANIKLLQNYECDDVGKLLVLAFKLKNSNAIIPQSQDSQSVRGAMWNRISQVIPTSLRRPSN